MDPDSKPRRIRNARKLRTARIRVTVTDARGRAIPAPGLAAWLARVAPPAAAGDVGLALVPDARMRSLNKQFRGKDVATDVLSFPSAGPPLSGRRRHAASARHAPLTPRSLGDIAIATGVARRQARSAGHSYARELKVLALHGLLHLIGYDHHDPADRGRMARLERRLRDKGERYEGLIERVERASAAGALRNRSAPTKRRPRARVGESARKK